MSSNYSVSTSESSSFCTNPALHHTQPRRASSEAAARGEPDTDADAAETAAASTTRSDVTPKKAAQSTKSAATAQESPSMTIRRVPTDYSKRMEDQKARSNALERYKMLVKANRLVPSDNEASPDSKKAMGAGAAAAVEEGEETDVSTPWRRSEQLPSTALRDGSAVSRTVLSDVSDGDDVDAVAADVEHTPPQQRKSAVPSPPRSKSCPRQEQQREGSSSSPISLSVSVERPAYQNSVVQRQGEGSESALGAVSAVPSVDLTKTLAHKPAQQPTSAAKSSTNEEARAPDVDEDDPIDYVSPELTQPFGHSSLKPRSTIRPGYEPVTDHRSSSLSRTSSFIPGQGQRTPRKQPNSQVRTHSSAAQGRQSASTNGPSTPRRKSTATAHATPPPSTVTVTTAALSGAVDRSAGDSRDDEQQHQQQHDEAANLQSQQQQQQPIKTEDGVVPLPGSKTAFWLRPSSAMYEMTTSIAAKRKDHVEQESAMTRTSSRRGSRSFHAVSSGSSSLCGTPRGRTGSAVAAAVVEAKPRFSTHMSTADRKLYEEGGAAANVPPVSTYDAIFSNRQSTKQRRSARRSQKVESAAPIATAPSTASSSVPRGTPRGDPPRRVVEPRAEAARSPTSLSRLSSNPPLHTPAEEPATAEEEEAGRVSARQQDALSKHCARVAASGAARAGESTAEVKPRKTKKGVAGQRKAQPKRTTAPAPADDDVHKKLVYEPMEEEEEEGEEPAPRTVAPHSSERLTAPYHEANKAERRHHSAAASEQSSPLTTLHGRRAGEDATPSKSRRREHDVTASPPRDEATNNTHDATAAAAVNADAHFAAQEAAMAREKEAARAQQAREALESCRLARQIRVEAARTTHTAGAATSTNEVIAAMLQGIVQQTRQVLPCYLCGELQCTSGYRVHVCACRPKTEGILREYFTNVAGLADIPAEVKERIEHAAGLEVPLSTSDVSVRDAFAKECYQCVKSTLVPCRKCGTHLRVQDVKEHEMLCGRAYYQNSRAAERVRSAVDRIERGSQD